MIRRLLFILWIPVLVLVVCVEAVIRGICGLIQWIATGKNKAMETVYMFDITEKMFPEQFPN